MKNYVNGIETTPTAKALEYYNNIDWTSLKVEQNKSIRDGRLSASDWTQTADAPFSSSVKTAWATYRQALRDLPDHSNWPNLESGDWPTKP